MELRRQTYATSAMPQVSSQGADMFSSQDDSLMASPLKRARTSQPTGSTRMYQSLSTPSGAGFGTPFSYSHSPSLLGSVAEQTSIASASFSGSQTPAYAQSVAYMAAGRQSAHVYEDSGMDPNAFLQARGCNPTQPLQPLSPSFSVSSALPSTTFTFDDFGQLQHHATAPSLVSYGTTLETNSSRQAGDIYDGAGPPVQMAHSSSQSSYLESPVYQNIGLLDKGSANDTDLRYTGSMHPVDLLLAPSTSLNLDIPQATSSYMDRSGSTQSFGTVDLSLPTMPQPLNGLSQQQLMAENMSRAPSNTSVRSSASSRARQSLRRYLDNQKTQLQPKVSPSEADTLSDGANIKTDLTASVETLMPSRKIASIKAKQEQQQKLPKLFCDLCNACPNGFRGDHELRRHHLNKHAKAPKRWICCDPRDAGKTPSFKPFQELSSCRKCLEKRQYAQDYNAAEHLRRVHFTPKALRKGGSGRSKQGSHRDSAGGQRRPDDQAVVPMDELKKWMKEIDVTAETQDAAAAKNQGSNEGSFDTQDNFGDNDSSASHGQSGGHSTSHGGDSGYHHGSGDMGGYQHIISPISAYLSPRISPWCPKDLVSGTMGANDYSPTPSRPYYFSGQHSADADLLFPAIYEDHPFSSPSESTSVTGSTFFSGPESDFSSHSPDYLDEIDPSLLHFGF